MQMDREVVCSYTEALIDREVVYSYTEALGDFPSSNSLRKIHVEKKYS
jgi:hypothetical protein